MPLSTISDVLLQLGSEAPGEPDVRDASARPMVRMPSLRLVAQARQVADEELVHGHEFVLDHD
eukprot:CAMPEP_0177197340 /NCGR_PEP_ID=MMETSP0367-20130122/24526_1 /TAXON_ID=447022 ORGANISM="Scrippsiella hangoei-like, Strain SHHI-4" /NCGR_SAMPLE_ID=MMETSP0367 /ASSEMBLY_ACC=CAM_ASM_000362 /LENGTH=62 /DNA_ID=CAMNT_0018645491 /DNA_START=52 /DNA_END=238 /DNA_ORIENTATION=+